MLNIKLQRILQLTIKLPICRICFGLAEGERAQSSIKTKTEIQKGCSSNYFVSAFFKEVEKRKLPNKKIVFPDVLIS